MTTWSDDVPSGHFLADTGSGFAPEPSGAPGRSRPESSELAHVAWTREGKGEERCAPARLWASLSAGKLHVTRVLDLEERSLAVLEPCPAAVEPRPLLHQRRMAILERRLAGESEKVIGFHFGLSSSTICGELNRALSDISSEPRSPGLTVLLARLYHHALVPSTLDARLTRASLGSLRYYVLTLPPLDVDPWRRLSPAEREICALFLRGETHIGIARRRGTRPRTISNQISSIFHKFNVSGRVTLMGALIRRELDELRCDEPSHSWVGNTSCSGR